MPPTKSNSGTEGEVECMCPNVPESFFNEKIVDASDPWDVAARNCGNFEPGNYSTKTSRLKKKRG
jgi:hypothetical protein